MVIITILAKTNPYTVNFDHPIREPKYVRLLSASLYNSWYNLKNGGEIKLMSKSKSKNIVQGHYSIESLAKDIENAFVPYGVKLETEINTAVGQMVIRNLDGEHIEFDDKMASFLGVKKVQLMSFVKKLNSPTAYFVHCDLVDREKNLLNGKPSDLLASFAVIGQPFQMENYQQESMYSLRDMPSGLIANSLNISVKDEHENLFDFNGFPMKFELEII